MPIPPLKIGILAPANLAFETWELRLFEKIASDDRFEIAALIVDARDNDTVRRNLLGKLARPGVISRALRLLTYRFDRRAAGPPAPCAAPRFERLLAELPRIEVRPTRSKFVDRFSDQDCVPIEALELDVLLRHAFGIIRGPILETAKFGVWSFHHGDNAVNRGGPPGFWETALGEPVTGATLQVLTPELDSGKVIARCWRTTLPNAIRNQQAIYELSISLIWRELVRLATDRSIETSPSPLYDRPLLVAPETPVLARYMAKRAKNVLGGLKHRLDLRLRRRPLMWTLAFGDGAFESASLWRSVLLEPPDNRYWADPFMLEHNGTRYILFEEFDYDIDRAWIAAGKIEDGRFTYLGKALDAGYHMSFPFLIEHQGEIYMIPEVTERNCIEVWRATDFPLHWELHNTALDGSTIADSVVCHHEGQWWLMTNISQTPDPDLCNELHIFMVDGPELRDVQPHPENPVVIDSRVARNAGRPFMRDGKLYRPSQNNSFGVYGYGLNLMEIEELTPARYRERLVHSAEPKFRDDIIAMHHVDQSGEGYVIDVCKRIGRKGPEDNWREQPTRSRSRA